ncbi:unnamed protein product [Pocillopora meandrina]|uniref:Uncharacterized protein n=1 Tax=Pocillopora meandrina TaxID=46732 RepID=A0AAU9XSF5_9CNID|nr:unnamed protein product [Pocillopora meandrina]
MNVKFPHDLNRKLRPLSKKDKELQASLPILKPFFPDDYFCHFALLITAIRLPTNDINMAKFTD